MARSNSPSSDALIRLVEEIARDVGDLARAQATSAGRAGTTAAGSGTAGGGAGSFKSAGGGGGGVSFSGAGNVTRGITAGLGGGLAASALGGVAGLAAASAASVSLNVLRTGATEAGNAIVNNDLSFSDAVTFGAAKGTAKIPFFGGRVATELAGVEAAAGRVKGILAPLARAGVDPQVRQDAELGLFAEFIAQEQRAGIQNRRVDRLLQTVGNDFALGQASLRSIRGEREVDAAFVLEALRAGQRAQYKRGSE